MKKLRIAFVLPVNLIAGGVLVSYRQAHYLAEQGHEVEILFSSTERGKEVTCYPGFSLRTKFLEEAVDTGTKYDVAIATWWETFYDMLRLRASHFLYFC